MIARCAIRSSAHQLFVQRNSMKYIITDKNEARVGGEYHQVMGDTCEGKVVRAGHCEKLHDGTYRVWGESIGYMINAQQEDADLLQELLKA